MASNPGLAKQAIQVARNVTIHTRRITADVYTFVRSQEINRTIAGFTFDHYIDEAKRKIKGEGTAIRDAAGLADGVRPTKWEALETLEREFRSSLDVIKLLAKQASGEEDSDA